MADDATPDTTPETISDTAASDGGATAVAEPAAAVQPTTLALGNPNPVEEEAPAAAPRPLAEPARRDAGGFVWGTGRRKTAVARVRVRPTKNEAEGGGGGEFIISSTKAKNKSIDEFFSEPQHRIACRKPQEATGMTGKLDIYVNVQGGGITGQAEAVLLGVARGLKGYDPTLEQTLRDADLLTRDSRKVERKKYGQAGTRGRFQFGGLGRSLPPSAGQLRVASLALVPRGCLASAKPPLRSGRVATASTCRTEHGAGVPRRCAL